MVRQRREGRSADSANTPAVSSGPSSPFGKLAFVAILAAVAAWMILPFKDKITLGLDLQGGTQMELKVDLDDAVHGIGERTLDEIRRTMEEEGITLQATTQEKPGTLVVSGVPEESRAAAEKIVAQHEVMYDISWTGDAASLVLRSSAETDIRANASRQVKETIGRRVNEFGVAEPMLTTSGNSGERIMLQLPGLDDAERVKRIITTASVMDFRLGRAEAASEQELLESLGGTLPPDVEILQGVPDAKRGARWYAIQRGTIARGEDLIDARVTTDRFAHAAIGFTLSSAAGKRFGEVTGKNIGKPLAITLDGKVLQYATIQDQIFSNGQITGRYNQKEASDAALVLRSGGLPARVSIQHEQTVGPALGKDSIAAGVKAVLYGSILIVLFMLVWYKGAGINAVVVLPLNLLFILAVLASFGATLTLPGIAGLVLTVGMAVDANVLVFERIREEIAHGKAPRAAVDAGFDRAFWTIFDSHMTALISAVFLYNFGTGPVKGFAVTLGVGLFASIFTAVFVSHSLFDLVFWLWPKSTSLSIAWTTFKSPSFPFMRWKIPFVTVTAVLALVSIAFCLSLPGLPSLQKGIDFEGGTQVVVKTAPGMTAQDLRERLGGSDFASVTIQEYGKPSEQQFLLRVKDAAASVSTTTVNAGEGAEAGTEGVAARLIDQLHGDLAGKALDVNAVGTTTLTEALTGAGLAGEEAATAARAVIDARTRAGGLLTSLDGLAADGVPEQAITWLTSNAAVGGVAVMTQESVGPEVGDELRGQAIRAVLWSMIGILIYVAFRFEIRFGIGAIVATFHDVFITLGCLAIMKVPIDTSVIAALLTVVGFSLNDTVVVFDRIREVMKITKGLSFSEVIDRSINQTLSRTVLVSGLTLVSVLALLIWGGPVLRGFAITMTVGILVGTYSSIFVASPVVLWLDRLNAKRVGTEARST